MRVLGLRTGRGQEGDWISVRGSHWRSQEVTSEWCCISSRTYMELVMPIPTPNFGLQHCILIYQAVHFFPTILLFFLSKSNTRWASTKCTTCIRPWGWWTRQTRILWPQLRAKSWHSCPHVDSPMGWLGPVTASRTLAAASSLCPHHHLVLKN